MVIVRLIGGLGNQLFQYAAGRAVAHRNGAELKLDVSAYEQYRKRTYGLEPFSLKASVASRAEVKQLTDQRVHGLPARVVRILRRVRILPRPPVFKERFFQYDASIQTLGGDAYLTGFWQSPKYFEDIEDLVRKEFTITTPPDEANLEYVRQIKEVNSVSLHVRRGDLVTNPDAPGLHYAIDLAYYSRAIEALAERLSNPYFFVFSDDIEWARENLSINHPVVFVDHNDDEHDYEDLRLMRHCDHHIIANSTFSWWGAWLSDNPEKIVIAPQAWFKKDTVPTEDLIPPTWIRM